VTQLINMPKFIKTVDKNVDNIILSLILIVVYPLATNYYLIFHSFVEIFSIVVACGIFIIARNTKDYHDNDFFILIGIGFLFIAVIDGLHTLAYKGMGVFPIQGSNLATQLWIAARYLQAITLLIAPFFIKRKNTTTKLFFLYSVATALLISSIFFWRTFPICYVEGVGLTPFKKISEYIISLILGIALYFLYINRNRFQKRIFHILSASIILTICAELSFTTYVGVYEFSNMLGHYFKLISFFLLYKAFISIGLKDPYALLFKKLKESEENYRAIVESQTEFITKFLPDTTHTFVNDAMCKFFGISKEDIVGKKISEMNIGATIPEEDMKIIENHFASFSPINQINTLEHRFVFPTGEVKWVEWTDKATFDESDNILEFQSVGRDITDKKIMGEEINLLYNAIEQAPTIIVITDKQGLIEYVNPKFIEITGYDPSEAVGKSPRILKTGPLPKEHIEALWKSISSGKTWKGEFQNIKKDGALYWESAAISPVRDSSEEITHFIKVSEDITYKKLVEKDIQEKEETLRGILSAAPIGINLMKERAIVWCNYNMTEITGYSEEELVGKNTGPLYATAEEYEKFGALYSQKLDMPIRFETQWLTKDRRLIDVSILLNPLNPYDHSKGFITIVLDITKTKTAQKQLDENLEYFAHLVDQIRNPLAIMSGFIQVGTENEKLKEKLLRQIDRIEELIKQLDQGWMDTENTRRFLKRYM